MSISCYPGFSPLDIDLKESLHPRLSLTSDGISEFTFSILYLYRNRYNYRVSRCVAANNTDSCIIISGDDKGKTFFLTPCGAPNQETLESLFAAHDCWEIIPESILNPGREKLQESGIAFTEDRNNFDYLYYRRDLAELAGKKYHKKKNHVNNFLNAYPDHEQYPMSAALVPAAKEVLDQWQTKNISQENDYKAAAEALDLFNLLFLKGTVFFVNGKPAAYCLGESTAGGKMFAVHFEKAVDEYRGIYQFMNQEFASSLPEFFTLINREQDMGNEGLRQAKLSYRPCGFVKKFTGRRL